MTTKLTIKELCTLLAIKEEDLGPDLQVIISGLPKKRFEQLEFVGDRVLNLAISEFSIVEQNWDFKELIVAFGTITSNQFIGKVITDTLHIPVSYPRRLADQIEACCGALWYRHHFPVVQRFAGRLVHRFFREGGEASATNFKSQLKWLPEKLEKRREEQASLAYVPEHFNDGWSDKEEDDNHSTSEEEEFVQKERLKEEFVQQLALETNSRFAEDLEKKTILHLTNLKVKPGLVKESVAPDSLEHLQALTKLFLHNSIEDSIETFVGATPEDITAVHSFTFQGTYFHSFGYSQTGNKEEAIEAAQQSSVKKVSVIYPTILKKFLDESKQ